VIGAALLTVFGILALATGIVLGAPLELSFIPFALGMLLLSAGSVVWGLGLRRHVPASGVWQALVLAGIATFAAVAIPADPWHDVSLTVMCATWSAIGVLLLRASRAGLPRRKAAPATN
jgi:hypothetical protein